MDFPGNSHKETGKSEQVEKPEVVKVVSGAVVKKKKPLGKRIKGVLFDGALRGALTYVTGEVLLPALRNMMYDTLTEGSKRVIYGDSPRRRNVGADPNRSRVSYNSPVNRGYSGRGILPDQPPHMVRRQEGNEVVLASKQDAENVLRTMMEMVDKYGQVTLADFLALCDLPSAHTDYKWGWTNLLYVGVLQRRDGYIIDLSPMEAL